MTTKTGTAKGGATRGRIIERAIAVASSDGIDGITLGKLASELGMSKSGLFAHFRSKEELQLQILDEASTRFRQAVIEPAFTAPRGIARLRALFDRWLDWEADERMPGGCLFVQASAELDDKPGPARDALVKAQQQWLDTVAETVRRAMALGDLRLDTDPQLVAFQMLGVMLAFHLSKRLLEADSAEAHVRAAFELILRPAIATR